MTYRMGAFEGTLTAKQVTIEPETRAENEYFEIQCTYHDDQTTLSVPFGNLFVAGARVTLTDTLVLDAAKHPWITVEATHNEVRIKTKHTPDELKEHTE